MSEDQAPRPQITDESNNKTVLKWLAGAAAAALVLGGGYYACSTRDQNTPAPMQTAYETGFSDADGAESGESRVDTAAAGAEPPPEAAPAPRAAPQRSARAVPVEATIGVTPASVTTTDTDEIVVTGARRPVWARTPNARRLAALYPERALERGREGEASLQCTVQGDGDLDCVRVSETPARSGFGTAAMRVARTLQHAPERWDGSTAAGSQVNLRVLFRLEDGTRRS